MHWPGTVGAAPHVAGSTPVSMRSAVKFVRDQVQRFRDGQPLLNVITAEY